MTPAIHLAIACLCLVLLTFAVGVRLLYVRTVEMREKRVHPQAASNSLQMAAKLQNVQAADNFRNLFETPVLFYALAAVAYEVLSGKHPFDGRNIVEAERNGLVPVEPLEHLVGGLPAACRHVGEPSHCHPTAALPRMA